MPSLRDIEPEIATLSRGEKAELARSLVLELTDSFPGIDSVPGVCGGEPCIVRTRIPVWVLEELRRRGTSESEILRCYPTLRARDLVHAWAWAAAHRDDVDRQIRENEFSALTVDR